MVFIKGGVSVISLTGFMFSGKTSTGRILSEKTGLAFYDVDNIIEKKCSMSVSDIFKKLGEPYFREAERAAVKELFEGGLKSAVVATGGGTICDRDSFEILAGKSSLVYLMVPYGEILKRKKEQDAASDLKRPLACEADDDGFARLFEKRRKNYEKAPFKVECAGLNPEETALRIMKLFEMKEIN